MVLPIAASRTLSELCSEYRQVLVVSPGLAALHVPIVIAWHVAIALSSYRVWAEIDASSLVVLVALWMCRACTIALGAHCKQNRNGVLLHGSACAPRMPLTCKRSPTLVSYQSKATGANAFANVFGGAVWRQKQSPSPARTRADFS